MGKNNDVRKNASGYYDATAWAAMKDEEKERIKFQRLIKTIFYICDLAGFHVEERIVLKDRNTGRIWR